MNVLKSVEQTKSNENINNPISESFMKSKQNRKMITLENLINTVPAVCDVFASISCKKGPALR